MAWESLVAPALRLIEGIRASIRRPALRILSFEPARDLRTWKLLPLGRSQKVLTLEVRLASGKLARRCIAVLTVTKQPAGLSLRETHFTLHWADTDYSGRTSGAEPVDIGPEGRRLDAVFAHSEQQGGGCWLAIPMALALPVPNQAYLPPGYYEARIDLTCENGDGASIEIRIRSPASWSDLAVEITAA